MSNLTCSRQGSGIMKLATKSFCANWSRAHTLCQFEWRRKLQWNELMQNYLNKLLEYSFVDTPQFLKLHDLWAMVFTHFNWLVQYLHLCSLHTLGLDACCHWEGLVQDCSNSIALAMELLQSCTMSLIIYGFNVLYGNFLMFLSIINQEGIATSAVQTYFQALQYGALCREEEGTDSDLKSLDRVAISVHWMWCWILNRWIHVSGENFPVE